MKLWKPKKPNIKKYEALKCSQQWKSNNPCFKDFIQHCSSPWKMDYLELQLLQWQQMYFKQSPPVI